ncbi:MULTISPECIES: hypothetical protein [Leeuwenhoekiella]|jgi:hypothetical protein|uniref:Uncharacterized protein n=1 Tax=Leeuwenhoekiella blandensis (strain CECT 7118 / CCUG 51940 / KCTC 22103 / MED217) TaxID=398720 RepID=A3XG63_LEEBM|nr:MULTISPECIES: hypothetical protein [Leeuwenhoekiella]EAQ50887.1 hypothetical protein MED217_15130 [Leeuwenhoekiella blandensis MED217]MAO42916.1 hypothetical protein [Leeuwenhoekiella sp.]HCW63042.1 hypothetical protein [Leeuwenhoekiella sp.]|tara:strand:+ start:418 stop:678 length:261 start_codon:yes stop_codon:yes gene_type:complete
MKYFKRNWNETRGDQYDSWGKSVWLFETDNNGEVLRQIEIYDNGKVLKYDNQNIEDEFGMLADQNIDLTEFNEFTIKKEEFENKWK